MFVKRPLLLAGIATFVAVDVVLVALAVAKVGSPSGDGSEAALPPPTQAQSPDQDPAASAVPSEATARPVLLDVGADGTLLRATRGDCKGEAPDLEVSTDGGKGFDSVKSPVEEILRIEVASASDIWLVGLDENCTPGFYRSADTGQTWDASAGTAGAWHVLADPDKAVHAPSGTAEVDCTPASLASVGFDVAYVGCADGTMRMTRDGGQNWRAAGEVAGLVQIAFRSRRDGFAVASGTGCAAQVWSTSNAGRSWGQIACLKRDGEARGVAVSDEAIFVQRGDHVVLGKGDGDRFNTVG